VGRRVTFSRNVTLSLSRTCVSRCKYCAFRTTAPHLHEPAEVQALIDGAARRGVKELLVLTGDEPGAHPGVQERLAALGFPDFVGYVAWCCERALERGLLPHTNLGALGRDDLARLREVTASQGLMLETLRADLVAHQGSPTKDPALRLATIRAAGELRIPFTSGILVGIGETPQDRLDALAALAALHDEHGHLQEVILQNFVPHRRFHGEEPAEVATEAARRFWASGVWEGPDVPAPAWASPVTMDDLVGLVRAARELLPGVAVQVPPNLSGWWPQLVAAGATDLGGLSSNGDHISPEHPFPSPAHVRKRLAADGVAVAERLCTHATHLGPAWIAPRVWDAVREHHPTFVPRAARAGAPRPDLVDGALERARDGERLRDEEVVALLTEDRPEAIEALRAAADELRASLCGDEVTFVVNRNINVSNVCVVGCAFCGFGQGRRSPGAYELDRAAFLQRVEEAVAFGATELCLQSGIHPDWELEDYLGWLRLAKEAAPQLHLHAWSPMEVAHMCDRSGLAPDAVFARLREAGLGSVPGTAAEVLHDGVRDRISPNKLPVARWVEVVEAAHRAGLRSTATVMFGHVETAAELAVHLRVVRDLQERTGGITEFVPLSFVPHQTLLGRTHGIVPIGREENLRHTAVFRLALGRSVRSLQASWVKMGLEAATEALRWGVNDLGGTLMEENITRLAGGEHGVRLDPPQLVAAAHAAGRPAAERTTLYEVRRRFPVTLEAAA
jgi:FO synthase